MGKVPAYGVRIGGIFRPHTSRVTHTSRATHTHTLAPKPPLGTRADTADPPGDAVPASSEPFQPLPPLSPTPSLPLSRPSRRRRAPSRHCYHLPPSCHQLMLLAHPCIYSMINKLININ